MTCTHKPYCVGYQDNLKECLGERPCPLSDFLDDDFHRSNVLRVRTTAPIPLEQYQFEREDINEVKDGVNH